MRIRAFRVAVALVPACWIAASPSFAQSDPRIVCDEILDLFQSHDVILFGEQHDAKLNFEFRMALLRSPKFADVVQDIVIESGNSSYQGLLDDFILKLRDVPIRDLQQVWRNTTTPTGVWDPPMYEEFVRAVREVNASRSPERRIRLLAGDPPIDWSAVTTGVELRPFLARRDTTPFEVIEREVIGKGRKALVIYGSVHLLKGTRMPTLASLLDERSPGKAFVLIPWSSLYAPAEDFQRLTGLGEGPALLNLDSTEWANLSTSGLFPFLRLNGPVGTMMDGILYLGSGTDERVDVPPEVQNDVAYQKELSRRRDIVAQAFRRQPR